MKSYQSPVVPMPVSNIMEEKVAIVEKSPKKQQEHMDEELSGNTYLSPVVPMPVSNIMEEKVAIVEKSPKKQQEHMDEELSGNTCLSPVVPMPVSNIMEEKVAIVEKSPKKQQERMDEELSGNTCLSPVVPMPVSNIMEKVTIVEKSPKKQQEHMKKMSEMTKSNRGRKRTLTDSASKRNRQLVSNNYNKSRIALGDQLDRWNALKDLLKLQTHADLAKVLMDSYDYTESQKKRKVMKVHLSETPKLIKKSTAISSTPGPSYCSTDKIQLPDVSGISSSDGEFAHLNRDSDMSGVEEISKRKPSSYTSSWKHSSSFMNPFQLSMAQSETIGESVEDHSSDEDYQPTFDFSTLMPDCKFEDESDYETDDEEDIADQSPEDLGPGVQRVLSEEDIDGFTEDQVFLVYSKPLLTLARTKIDNCCAIKGCEGSVSVKTEIISSAVYLKWICSNNHLIHKWCSQPVLNRRMHGGDLLLASAVLFSGNNFQKVAQFAKYLNLPILGNSTFHKIQRTYLIPSIDQHWVYMQDEILDEFRNKDVVVLGDGRMDSPGHCAQYCTYSFMELETKKILCIVTLDKRLTEKKKYESGKGMLYKGDEIPQRQEHQSGRENDYADIKHSYDVWHGAKNLGKRIMKVANKNKDNKVLLKWTTDIVNHFWHVCEKSDTYNQFIGLWFGIVHHVVNEHSWIIPYSDDGGNACSHGPLPDTREKPWLEKGSKAHDALRNVIMDKRFLNTIPYYLLFRSTSDLESFQNLILKYSSKRNSYKPPAFKARNILAAMDHNANVCRPVKQNRDGSLRYQRNYNKKSGRWSVCPVKTDKSYVYIKDLTQRVVLMRLDDGIGMSGPAFLSMDDPRRLSATIAPILPPPTDQIVQEQKSRFSREDPVETID